MVGKNEIEKTVKMGTQIKFGKGNRNRKTKAEIIEIMRPIMAAAERRHRVDFLYITDGRRQEDKPALAEVVVKSAAAGIPFRIIGRVLRLHDATVRNYLTTNAEPIRAGVDSD